MTFDMTIDFTRLEQRINLFAARAEDMKPIMSDIGNLVLNSNLEILDAGGKLTAFQPTKRQTGRPPLGGSMGSIGQSEHVTEVTERSVTISASGLPYNVIHQTGGIIKHPGSNQLQVFPIMGRMVFSHGTAPHDIPIPSRRYFRLLDEIVAEIKSRIGNYLMS